MDKMCQVCLLGVIQVLQQSSGRCHSDGKIFNPYPLQRVYPEMTKQNLPAAIIIKDMRCQRIDRNVILFLQFLQTKTADQKSFVADNLQRFVFHQFIVQLLQIIHFRQKIISGSDICHGNADFRDCIGNTHQEMILRFLLDIQIRPRRHNPDYFPLYQPLRLLWVFHLFTDGYFISFIDQSGQISFHRMIRNAAHGRTFLQTAGFSCQSQFQLL